MTVIQTHTGHLFDLARPRAEDVRLDDILIPLTRVPRFSGHTLQSWSVAQHTLLCDELRAPDYDPETRMAILLHDTAEAYIGDISRPLRQILGAPLAQAETQIELAILQAFGSACVNVDVGEMHRVDDLALATEKHLLMTESDPWPGLPDPTVESCRALLRVQQIPCVYSELLARLYRVASESGCKPLKTLGL